MVELKIRQLLQVDIRMLPSKTANILCGVLLGCFLPYRNPILVSVGMSTRQAGLITGVSFGPSSIATPLWGLLADYSRRRKLILIFLCLGATFPFFSIPFISFVIYPYPKLCATQTNATLGNNSKPNITGDETLGNACLDRKPKQSVLFYVLLFVIMFGLIFFGPLVGYIDCIVMNIIKTGDNEASYGAQTVFRSVGVTIASVLAGIA